MNSSAMVASSVPAKLAWRECHRSPRTEQGETAGHAACRTGTAVRQRPKGAGSQTELGMRFFQPNAAVAIRIEHQRHSKDNRGQEHQARQTQPHPPRQPHHGVSSRQVFFFSQGWWKHDTLSSSAGKVAVAASFSIARKITSRFQSPSPPVLRGRGAGVRGLVALGEAASFSRNTGPRPLTPAPLPRSTGGEGEKTSVGN